MFTETSVHFSHSIRHHFPEDSQHRQHHKPHNLQFDTAECQLLSVFSYHSQSSWLLPLCCLLQTFCKKQHCNVATSSGLQPNYTIITLEQQKCQTMCQVPGCNFGPSCCRCIPFLPTPPTAVCKTVYQYQLCEAQSLPYVPLTFTTKTILLLTHSLFVCCVLLI
jgi:hypothetical protein